MRCCSSSLTSKISVVVSLLPTSFLSPHRPTRKSDMAKRYRLQTLTSILTFFTAMRPKDVSDALRLETIAKNHTWKVEPSCATTGEGIFEGLAWLGSNVKVPTR
ncbi:hypothetical protein BJ546DRAFT_102321 [Cryomyces antarcticus]